MHVSSRPHRQLAGHIDREDWGLTWSILLESGGMMVSKAIDLEVNIEPVLTR